MTTIHQMLIKQIADEVQSLPENLVREVLDFIGYLRAKYEQNGEETRQEVLLATLFCDMDHYCVVPTSFHI